MTEKQIDWSDLNHDEPVTEPGIYTVDGLGRVFIRQQDIDYVQENGAQWGFVVKQTLGDDVWRIMRVVRGL